MKFKSLILMAFVGLAGCATYYPQYGSDGVYYDTGYGYSTRDTYRDDYYPYWSLDFFYLGGYGSYYSPRYVYYPGYPVHRYKHGYYKHYRKQRQYRHDYGREYRKAHRSDHRGHRRDYGGDHRSRPHQSRKRYSGGSHRDRDRGPSRSSDYRSVGRSGSGGGTTGHRRAGPQSKKRHK